MNNKHIFTDIKMSFFVIRVFWVVVVKEGGVHGILPTVVGYTMRGGTGKNTPNSKGEGLPKNAREKI